MDAEIWSYADTRNGRLILRLITLLVLAKELAVAALPALGLAAIDPIFAAAPQDLPVPPGVALLMLKLVLLLCLNAAFGWARIGLGLISLITSAYAAALVLEGPIEPGNPVQIFTLANAALGFGLGLALLVSAQLKAHLWRIAATRLTIPIPGDDEPAERPSQRSPSVGESLAAATRRLFGFLFILATLGAVAHFYGWTRPLLKALGH